MLSYNICLQTTTRIHVSTAALFYYPSVSCSSSGFSRQSPRNTGGLPELEATNLETRQFVFVLSYVAR